MKKRSVILLALCIGLSALFLAGCGANSSVEGEGVAQVYYLNFKPEVNDIWQEVAKSYTEETGIPLRVETVASGQYDAALKSRLDGEDAPTLFQFGGPVDYEVWKEYCLDLTDTDLYKNLTDSTMAIHGEDGKAYGIPFAVEGYGIIYNAAIMDRYFALEAPKTASMEEINSIEVLKEVVMDMQARKEELGIDGVFASTSLKPGEDWRWQTHLMNIPVYYEFRDRDETDAPKIDFTYSDKFKTVFDLYTDNSVASKASLGSIDVAVSMAEFAMGQCAMVQNGNWSWIQISNVQGNVVESENAKFLPIYFGVDDERQGLCIGTENFWAVNSHASAEDIQATKDFVTWLITTDKGKAYMYKSTDEGGLGFLAPFITFTEAERSNDPLSQEMYQYMEQTDKGNINWVFTTFPNQEFKNDLGHALLQYVNGQLDWDTLKTQTVNDWADQKAILSK